MRIKPDWPIALAVFIAYNAVIFVTWHLVGADYRDLVSAPVAWKSLVLPLAIGAVFMTAAVTALGWWGPAMAERSRSGPRWAFWATVVAMLAMFVAEATGIRWTSLAPPHLIMLIIAGLLVGFNEELAARGVLVVGLRGATARETWVWFWSLLMFGAAHVANILSGLPWYGGLIQGVFAFLTGTGFYVLRRTSGTLLLPMAAHALWDFLSFGVQATSAPAGPALSMLPVVFLVSLVALAAVLRHQLQKAPT